MVINLVFSPHSVTFLDLLSVTLNVTFILAHFCPLATFELFRPLLHFSLRNLVKIDFFLVSLASAGFYERHIRVSDLHIPAPLIERMG